MRRGRWREAGLQRGIHRQESRRIHGVGSQSKTPKARGGAAWGFIGRTHVGFIGRNHVGFIGRNHVGCIGYDRSQISWWREVGLRRGSHRRESREMQRIGKYSWESGGVHRKEQGVWDSQDSLEGRGGPLREATAQNRTEQNRTYNR